MVDTNASQSPRSTSPRFHIRKNSATNPGRFGLIDTPLLFGEIQNPKYSTLFPHNTQKHSDAVESYIRARFEKNKSHEDALKESFKFRRSITNPFGKLSFIIKCKLTGDTEENRSKRIENLIDALFHPMHKILNFYPQNFNSPKETEEPVYKKVFLIQNTAQFVDDVSNIFDTFTSYQKDSINFNFIDNVCIIKFKTIDDILVKIKFKFEVRLPYESQHKKFSNPEKSNQ